MGIRVSWRRGFAVSKQTGCSCVRVCHETKFTPPVCALPSAPPSTLYVLFAFFCIYANPFPICQIFPIAINAANSQKRSYWQAASLLSEASEQPNAAKAVSERRTTRCARVFDLPARRDRKSEHFRWILYCPRQAESRTRRTLRYSETRVGLHYLFKYPLFKRIHAHGHPEFASSTELGSSWLPLLSRRLSLPYQHPRRVISKHAAKLHLNCAPTPAESLPQFCLHRFSSALQLSHLCDVINLLFAFHGTKRFRYALKGRCLCLADVSKPSLPSNGLPRSQTSSLPLYGKITNSNSM